MGRKTRKELTGFCATCKKFASWCVCDSPSEADPFDAWYAEFKAKRMEISPQLAALIDIENLRELFEQGVSAEDAVNDKVAALTNYGGN